MNKIISKLGISGVCLISFIICGSVFTSENAFSGRLWKEKDMEISYNPIEQTVTFMFLFYDYTDEMSPTHSFMYSSIIRYSEDGKEYNKLISTQTNIQKNDKDLVWMSVNINNPDQKINFPKYDSYSKDLGRNFNVGVKLKEKPYLNDHIYKKSKTAYMSIKWYLPESCKRIVSVIIDGYWTVFDYRSVTSKIHNIYTLNFDKSNSNTIEFILNNWLYRSFI